MAWMETDCSKHTYFRWKVKWRLEHLGVLGIMGEMAPLMFCVFVCLFVCLSLFQLGSWGTSSFENDERKEKFLRLMGAFKQKGAGNVSGSQTKSGKASFQALPKDQEARLHKRLENDFERAMDIRLGRRGCGLGYNPHQDPDNKIFFIDKTAKSDKL